MKLLPGKKSYFTELLVIIAITLVAFNFIQCFDKWLPYFQSSRKWKLYFFLYGCLFVYGGLLIYNSFSKEGVLGKCWQQFKNLSIPTAAKWAIGIVFIGNLLTIGFAKSYYPFYEVGMFRWSSRNWKPAPVLHKTKYYYYEQGEPKILDLRRESFFLLHDHFGWGYTHEFTFAAAYHNKAQKENFEFIQSLMNARGIDTLWVGVHTVNYTTGEVSFNPDVCNAIAINEAEKLHYGPIYIPDYQLIKCDYAH
jgi:hypothetical protein